MTRFAVFGSLFLALVSCSSETAVITPEPAAEVPAVPEKPGAPGRLAATGGDTEVRLIWKASERASSYQVLRSGDEGGPYAAVNTSIITLSYTDTTVTNGTAYFYVVQAVNDAGVSENSNEAPAIPQATVRPLPAPLAPSDLFASAAGSTQIELWWTDLSTNEDGFIVERKTGPGGTYSVIATLGQDTVNFSDTGLTASTHYYYRVAAFNQAGTSAPSNEDDAATLAPLQPPAAPSVLVATAASNSQIGLTWVDNAGNETGFKVERKTGAGGTYVLVATLGQSATGYADSGLSPSTPYYYRVVAYNAAGSSGNVETSATTQALPPVPASPSSLIATAVGAARIDLAWADNSNDESGFKIERKTGSGGTFGLLATVGAGITGFQNVSLGASTRYYYRVYAFNAAGNSASYSNVADATTGLPAPTNFAAAAGDGYITLTWDAMAGAGAYQLYASTSDGVTQTNGTKIANTSATVKTDGGLINGITYYYTVTAIYTAGESDGATQASATPGNGAGAADPFYPYQWHLSNTGQAGANGVAGTSGEDIRAAAAWAVCTSAPTCRGEGVRVAVVDDGIEIAHQDIFANIATGLGYNYLDEGNDPTPPDSTSNHGTAVAGIIAARDLNGVGVRGVAPRANLVGYNLLQINGSSYEADAMTRGAASVSVNTNSWGAPDNTGNLAASTLSWRSAINTGLTTGRAGRGIVYTWAAGNGGSGDWIDNSNYDGQANYRGVMAVGAVNDQGTKSSYSERGANLWVSAPGGEFCDSHTITTIDRTGNAGDNKTTVGSADYSNRNYTQCMNGTSSATPMVAGAAALVIQANPDLGWRDVRAVLAASARLNDPTDLEWAVNGGGFNINPNYGFGVIDVQAAAALAKTWGANFGPEKMYTPAFSAPGASIPDNNATGVSNSIVVTGSDIAYIEFIEITFSASHTYAGDLEIMLKSPAGTEVLLAEPHSCEESACSNYSSWVFGSAHQLGETADGTWALYVKDLVAQDTGTFQSWKLKFYGH